MFVKGTTAKYVLVILLSFQELTVSSALLYIVRSTCARGTVFTPVPSTVNNICLQCLCVMANISYCKPLIVQLSVICSAAIAVNPVTVATTTTRAPVTVPTIPTIPTAAPTTSVGINPRASTPAAAAMMMGAPSTLMVSNPPVIMMMMSAGAGGMSMAAAPPPTPPPTMAMAMTPAPAGK